MKTSFAGKMKGVAVGVAMMGLAAGASAAIIVDDEGNGFVGKGDVQLLFVWNNAKLQSCATSSPAEPTDAGCLRFHLAVATTTTTERSWICTNANNQNTQERERTSTTSYTAGGVVASVARSRNQITGFNLNGGLPDPVIGEPVTEGPPLNSCPAGPWSLTTPAGDPVVVSVVGTKTLTITDVPDNVSYPVDLSN